MAERVDYKKPGRLNTVTVVMALVAAAFGYFMWLFFPHYLDAWTVDHILREAASAVYKANRLGEPARTTALKEIVDKARLDIVKKAGVSDPDLLVNLDVDGPQATMSAAYQIKITHPILEKTTKLKFERSEKANIKAVSWD